jgi:hypothetical protein
MFSPKIVDLLAQLLQLIQRAIAAIKAAQRQEQQDDLEANPGKHLHDHFSSGVLNKDDSSSSPSDTGK